MHVHLAFSENQEPILCSYQNVVSGFAARLTAVDVAYMSKKDRFVSARRERILRIQMTRNPRFLGFHKKSGLWKHWSF